MNKLLAATALLGLTVLAWQAHHLRRARIPHAIVLSWKNPSPTPNHPVTRSEIFRGTAPGQEDPRPIANIPISPLSNPAPGTGTYIDSSGIAGSTYYYAVVEANSAGQSSRSNETSATFLGDKPQLRRSYAILTAALSAVLFSVCGLLFSTRHSRPNIRSLSPAIRREWP